MKGKLVCAMFGLCLCLSVSALLFTGGCSSRGSAGQLVIITPHTNDIKETVAPLFQEWYRAKTGKEITIKWISMGGSNDDLKYVRSEFAKNPAGINIDLFWGGGIAPYYTLKKANLLQRTDLDPALLKIIPGDLNGVPLYDPEHTWYGSCLSSFGILQNRMVCASQKVPDAKTWQDLAQPTYKDLLGSADPRKSGSNFVAFDMVLQNYGWTEGWKILTRLAANMKKFTDSSKSVVSDLTTGETGFCLAVDYYAWKEIEKLGPEKMNYFVPEDVNMVNPDCFAVLKGAPRAGDAKLFMEYVLSKEFQTLWMITAGQPGGPPRASLFRLSIRPDTYADADGKTIMTFNPFGQGTAKSKYDVEKSEMLWDVTGDLFGSLLVDRHAELKQAWEKVIANGCPAAAIEEMGRAPITYEEAVQLAATWKDPKVRNDTIQKWQGFAKEKYARAATIR